MTQIDVFALIDKRAVLCTHVDTGSGVVDLRERIDFLGIFSPIETLVEVEVDGD